MAKMKIKTRAKDAHEDEVLVYKTKEDDVLLN